MILQALYDYYQRKRKSLPQEGFELKEIKFVIIINKEGKFADLQDLREGRKGKHFLLPKSIARSGSNSWQTAYLLWDHTGYVLRHPKNDSEESVEMALKQHQSFLTVINNLPEAVKNDEGVNAVLSFYNMDQIEEVKNHPAWQDCSKIAGCNVTFRLDRDTELIPQRHVVADYQKSSLVFNGKEDDDQNIIQPCLITGERNVVSRLHTPTPILGSKSSARLVAFQKNSGYDSYGKEQAYNAPVSIKAEASYSTALKHLINSTTNKKIIANTTVLFWAEKKTEEYNPEEVLSWVIAFQKTDDDDPDKGVNVIESFISSIFTGRRPVDKTNHFYVLGLSPNAARISVRFWKAPSVEKFGMNIKKHFDDFEIIHGPKEPKYLSLYQILSATAFRYKMENVPPNLASAVIESIIDGTQYPTSLIHQCVRRIRAEQNVNRTRAAILKAYLNRFNKIHKQNEKEITMGLDPTNKNAAYRIGRLFAALEKIQERANPGINTTIRDRFYGAASSTPISVFPRLLSLKNSHLKKLSDGEKKYYEKLIGAIMSEISSFPANLSLPDQAHFAVGYYHQRQDFYTKKS